MLSGVPGSFRGRTRLGAVSKRLEESGARAAVRALISREGLISTVVSHASPAPSPGRSWLEADLHVCIFWGDAHHSLKGCSSAGRFPLVVSGLGAEITQGPGPSVGFCEMCKKKKAKKKN